jgi:hypothetical protein
LHYIVKHHFKKKSMHLWSIGLGNVVLKRFLYYKISQISNILMYIVMLQNGALQCFPNLTDYKTFLLHFREFFFFLAY